MDGLILAGIGAAPILAQRTAAINRPVAFLVIVAAVCLTL
jgi:hypothetical protein